MTLDTAESVYLAEPTEWFIVFHRKSMNRVLSFLAFGELKHVSAFGYCPGFKAWVLYDVTWSRTRIRLVADGPQAHAALLEITQGCEMLKVPHAGQRPMMSSRIGFYCVTAVKHLLGLRCVAVTPGQLYRYLRQNGGVFIGGSAEPAPNAT